MERKIGLFKGGAESVVAQSANTVLVKPWKSLVGYVENRLTDGYLNPTLTEVDVAPEIEVNTLVDVLKLNTLLSSLSNGEYGVPDRILGVQKFRGLEKCVKLIEENFGIDLADLAFFDNSTNQAILFKVQDGCLSPFIVSKEGFEDYSLRTAFGFEDTEFAKENAALSSMQALGLTLDNMHLIKLTTVGNAIKLYSNPVYGRNGELVGRIENQGAATIGEFQEALYFLAKYAFSIKEGKIAYDPKAKFIMQCLLKSAFPNEEINADEFLREYAQDILYFDYISQYFNEHPDSVIQFMTSDVYRRTKDLFIDEHFVAIGQTNFELAKAMLANFYLADFRSSPNDSTQNGVIKQIDYEIGRYLNQLQGDWPKIFTDSKQSKNDYLMSVSNLVKNNPYAKRRMNYELKQKVILQIQKANANVGDEVARQQIGLQFMDWVKEVLPGYIIENTDKRQKPFLTLISNLSLGLVGDNKEERIFAIAKRLYNNGQFYQDCDQVSLFELNNNKTKSVETAIRYILSGEVADGKADGLASYYKQLERISTEGNLILDYLANGENVPAKVKEFFTQIKDRSYLVKILETFGPEINQDYQQINPFIKSISELVKTTEWRFVVDFVNGVQTELISITKTNTEILAAKFGNKWKNHNFSGINYGILASAIDSALKRGEHRIDILNHELGVKRETLKDQIEFLEKVFGWKGLYTSFLEHEINWNIWNMLGGAWDCICFYRKNLFSDTFFQF